MIQINRYFFFILNTNLTRKLLSLVFCMAIILFFKEACWELTQFSRFIMYICTFLPFLEIMIIIKCLVIYKSTVDMLFTQILTGTLLRVKFTKLTCPFKSLYFDLVFPIGSLKKIILWLIWHCNQMVSIYNIKVICNLLEIDS